MTETQVVTGLLKELKKHGFFWKASDKYYAGIPDIIGCVKGLFIALEVKIDSNVATPLQEYHLDCISRCGGIAAVITYKNKTKKYKILDEELNKQGTVECILKRLASSISWNVSK